MAPIDGVETSRWPGGRDAEGVLEWALRHFHPRVAIACSFSREDVALVDLAREVLPDARVFAIDTGRLNEETYEVAERVRVELGVRIEWHFPEAHAVEALLREKGPRSFRNGLDERHACCGVRKVEPLSRALRGLDAWITGQRRAQGPTRTELEPIERDEAHGGIVKVNPLAAWTDEDLDRYFAGRTLPVNRLHAQGYPSIGCEPCTRAVRPGEDPRAGRWWWESAEQKECGLHAGNVGGARAGTGTGTGTGSGSGSGPGGGSGMGEGREGR